MGRKIAITGATGGLGNEIVLNLAEKKIDLIFVDRNPQKSQNFAQKVKEKYPDVNIDFVTCDLSSIESVKNAEKQLEEKNIDTLILNSGIYNVPLKKLELGYNNVFQVNFISQYYLARKLVENGKVRKVVAVGSIANNFSKLNENDIDFSNNAKINKTYGNSKRFFMFSLYDFFKDKKDCKFAIAHPGITLTNMTNHYPKWINWFIKFGIKVVFPSPKKAARNIVRATDEDCEYLEWIGPWLFNIWGRPKKKKLNTCKEDEIKKISAIADKIYKDINK